MRVRSSQIRVKGYCKATTMITISRSTILAFLLLAGAGCQTAREYSLNGSNEGTAQAGIASAQTDHPEWSDIDYRHTLQNPGPF